MTKVLIITETKSVRKGIIELLSLEDLQCIGCDNFDVAQREIARDKSSSIKLLLIDSSLGDLPEALFFYPFLILASTPSIGDALKWVRSGALDYVSMPVDMNLLLVAVRSALAASNEEISAVGLASAPRVRPRLGAKKNKNAQISCFDMVGDSAQLAHLKKLIGKVAPTDARVMILGENGTGKELVAKNIHFESLRRDAPFVEVNCAAIPSELIESELFGHEKGAFTSAIKQRSGKFEQAHGGTLFLDEIGDMSLSAQAKVLRALQEKKVSRVGSDREIDVDVRVIAATNKDIRTEIAEGRFREDLYHRLGVVVLKVAALRDRSEDIPLLVNHFMHQVCQDLNIDCKKITEEAIEMLSQQAWTGNIRELRNIVERLVVLSEGEIQASDVETHYILCY